MNIYIYIHARYKNVKTARENKIKINNIKKENKKKRQERKENELKKAD